jgi:hypothetical protein
MVRRLESTPMKRKAQRQYDEQEMASILERAAKLQGSTALVPVSQGRTLAEIRAIAVEAGMDGGLVEVAAEAFDSEANPRSPIFGRPLRMELRDSFSGELDDDDRQLFLGILRRSIDAKGGLKETDDTLEWRHFGLLGRELVVLTTHKGKTHLEVRGRYRRGFVATFVAGGLAGGFASAGLLDIVGVLQHLDALAAPFILAGGFFSGRALWGWFSAAKERMLRRTAERLGEFTVENALPPHDPSAKK